MQKPSIFKKNLKHLVLSFLSLVCLQYVAYAQGVDAQSQYIPSMIPINPTAAALGEYGNTPVSLYSGRTNITIPIYTITKDWITLPIYLDYNSGGIKVEDVASWVGMGWSLNFGGSISRQVRGKADYVNSTYLVNLQNAVWNFITDPANADTFSHTSLNSYLEKILEGEKDAEVDMYFLNMNGFSGKIFFDTSGHPITIPNSQLKIEYSGSNPNEVWKITTTDGTQYYFQTREYTSTQVMPLNPNPANGSLAVTNWYLSKIVNPSNTDSITFNYESDGYSFDGLGTEIKYTQFFCFPDTTMDLDPTPHPTPTTTINDFTIQRLTAINGNGFQINFNKKSTERCDLPGDYALDNIQIKDGQNSVFKTYQFYESYRVGSNIETGCSSTAPEFKRLFLDSLRVKGSGGIYEPYYRMTYNDALAYPSRLSKQQDHWGYYSRYGNPSSMIPSQDYIRAPDTVWNQIGMLTSLYYPTGGFSDFEYETNTAKNLPWKFSSIMKQKDLGVLDTPQFSAGHVSINFTLHTNNRATGDTAVIFNTFWNSGSAINDPNNQYLGHATIYLINNNTHDSVLIPSTGLQTVGLDTNINYTLSASYFIYDVTVTPYFNISIRWHYFEDVQESKLAGGLRIKSIKDYDRTGNLANMQRFYYTMPNSDSSSGIIAGYPMYKGTFRHTYFVQHSGGAWDGDGDGLLHNSCYNTTQSFSNYSLLLGSGFPVGYSYIKEVLGQNGEGGMNEYFYSTPPDSIVTEQNPFDLESFHYHPDSGPSYSYLYFPFSPQLHKEWEQGLLKRKNLYKKTGNDYSLVRSNGYNYNIYDTHSFSYSRNLKIGIIGIIDTAAQPELKRFAVEDYYTFSGRSELASDTVTDYRNGKAVQSVTTYHYDPDYFYKTDESMTNSDGIVSKTAYTYPPGMAASSVRTAMLNKNMIGLPVSTKTYNNGSLTATELNNYGLFNGSQVQLKNKQSSTYNNALQTEITFNKYDAKGNLLGYTTRQGISTVFLWGYNGAYPVAQIEHVDTAALTTYLNAHPTIQSTCNNPPNDQALRNVIQQLRNQFPNALITGMTYRPPLGMTSKTDPDNMVTYYDYDSFGRLADIKDKDGKVLKKYTYHYKQ